MFLGCSEISISVIVKHEQRIGIIMVFVRLEHLWWLLLSVHIKEGRVIDLMYSINVC